MSETRAEIRLPTDELRDDLPFWQGLGFRLDAIWPADDPRVGVLSGHGLRLRLEKGAPEAPGTVRVLTPDPDGFAGGARVLAAPNGTRVEIEDAAIPFERPETVHSFVVRRLADEAPWVIGRAGMHYRDLVPDRLGGAIIASHIRIPDGGPVPDVVHYHTVGFQLIFCHRGWVDLVYEDQGGPFRLEAGCCVIQPPEIRHRVLHASPEIEVLEIGVPAEHVTTIDHDMTLPNGPADPDREFGGQRFVHHREDGAEWGPWRLPGAVARDTGIGTATKGEAGVRVVRAEAGALPWSAHGTDILFGFVRGGEGVLEGEGRDPAPLAEGDAFAIPPGMRWRLTGMDGLEWVEVSLPAEVPTEIG
ncbi:MAG: cupin domain-containing protein [Hasllibacter sp.]